MCLATVTHDYRITIPKEICEKLGLEPGQKAKWETDGKSLWIIFLSYEESDDEFAHKLESDPRLLARVERARQAFREGKGVKIEDIKFDEEEK